MPSPPITIGELTDVPAPDSAIASAWAQEVSHRVVHRFATTAARDVAYPANAVGAGSVCAVGAAEYISDGTVWVLLAPQSAVDTVTAAGRRMGCQITGPAGSTGTGALAVLQFTAEVEDTDGLYSPGAPQIVTLPAAGIWAVSINVIMSTAYNGGGSVDLLMNGGIPHVIASDFRTGAAAGSIVLRATAGTTFGARLLNASGVTISWTGTTLDCWRVTP